MHLRRRTLLAAGLAGLTSGAAVLPSAPAASATGHLRVTPSQQARAVEARMTLAQEAGQLIMAAVPATDPGAGTTLVTRWHVGGVFLAGRSHAGVAATAAGTARLRRAALSSRAPTSGVGLWTAADQEGGYVQVLSGPGFSTIPTAVAQSRWSSPVLRRAAAVWGRQLTRAGLDVDLAPVTDVVPGDPAANAPIGYYQRQYGATPAAVARAVSAVVTGYRSAHVTATLKHFPGLGRVTANTDTTAGVTDPVTTRSAATEVPWRAGIAAGAGIVMVSLARYSLIDNRSIAAFSAPVITGMLRGDLGWKGVVMSDDLGGAVAVAAVRPGRRAVRFIEAGGDVVLTDAAEVPAMLRAVIARARTVPVFRAKVEASVLRVLIRKAEMGLLPASG